MRRHNRRPLHRLREISTEISWMNWLITLTKDTGKMFPTKCSNGWQYMAVIAIGAVHSWCFLWICLYRLRWWSNLQVTRDSQIPFITVNRVYTKTEPVRVIECDLLDYKKDSHLEHNLDKSKFLNLFVTVCVLDYILYPAESWKC